MAELLLLAFAKREIDRLARAAERGDQSAVDQLESLWADYEGQALACFLCDEEIEGYPRTEILPDPANPHIKVTGAPICKTCWALPKMVRWHRCLKITREMHRAKTGRQYHYHVRTTR